jgi:hypothetical protein
MFGNLLKGVVGITTLPIDILADVVTLGGSLNDRGESYTGAKAESIMDALQRAADPND